MNKVLVQNSPYIDEYLDIATPPKKLKERILELGIDCLINLVNTGNSSLVLKNNKQIPIRIGPSSRLKFWENYTHPIRQKRSQSIQAETEYNLDLLKVLPLGNYSKPVPKLYFTDQELKSFRHQLTKKMGLSSGVGTPPYIVFHCGMRGSALNLKKDHYLDIFAGLLFTDYPIILTGSSSDEKELNDYLEQNISNPRKHKFYNMTGAFSLRELCALIKLATLYVGPSTGPTHIAAAAGTKIISFYPPIQVTSKQRWGPLGHEGHIFTPDVSCPAKYHCKGKKCSDYYCMDKISTKDVLDKSMELINSLD